MRLTHITILAAATLTAACADSPTAPVSAPQGPSLQQSEGRGVLQRYVAIGTSISMGWQSDGVVEDLQATSWPAQLARLGSRELTQPYIQSPGCPPPLIAPLSSAMRRGGFSALLDAAALPCAPLVAGITLPTENVSLNEARTSDALFTTPENANLAIRPLYTRVLPPGATQVSAMQAQHPKLVSVELGANEVLGARSGALIPGVTILPSATWAPLYRQVLDGVEASTAKHVVLVGLLTNPASIPALASGGEIAANAAALFVGAHVQVQPDCAATNSQNLLFIMPRLPLAILQGLASKAQGGPTVPFTCEAGPAGTPDLVLTPDEQLIMGGLLAEMNAIIQAEAAKRGWAYFSLDALYGAPGVRVPLNVVALMQTETPFGPFMSLDGVHPNAAGHALIAEAAARALNETYGLGIPVEAP